MSIKEYIHNIQDIYFKYGLFWSWLYKIINRKKVTIGNIDELSGQETTDLLITYLLSPNWYVTDPLASCQINPIALEEIIHKY